MSDPVWTAVNPISVGDSTIADDYALAWENARFIHETVNAPSGTIMLFKQNSAPMDWTRKADWQDGAMLVYEAAGALTAGGSVEANAGHSHGLGSLAILDDSTHTHAGFGTISAADAGHTHTLGSLQAGEEGSAHSHVLPSHLHYSISAHIEHWHDWYLANYYAWNDGFWVSSGGSRTMSTHYYGSDNARAIRVGSGNHYPYIDPGYPNILGTTKVQAAIVGQTANQGDETLTEEAHAHTTAGSVAANNDHGHVPEATSAPSAAHGHIGGGTPGSDVDYYIEVMAATRD